MQYKTLDEQIDITIEILNKNKELIDILNYVDELKLNNYYISAGSIFQTIWNYLDNRDINYGIKDIDIIYHNINDILVDTDIKYYEMIQDYSNNMGYKYEIDVSNEARMHLWKKEHEGIDIKPYISSEDAIKRWIATIHAIGITKNNGNIKIYAPYGLSDIYSKTIRPIKHIDNNENLYNNKVKSWSKRFDNLNIVRW